MRILKFILGIFLKRKVLSIVLLVIFGLIALLVYYLNQPKQPEYITATAELGELLQKVEVVGEVVSERNLALQFPRSGVVAKVYVDEGDIVKAGQLLASVRNGDLGANISSYRARVESAQAELQALQEGTRPEDIAITQAELRQQQTKLEVAKTTFKTAEENFKRAQEKLTILKQEVDTALSTQVYNVGSLISKELTSTLNALRSVEDIYETSNAERELRLNSQSTEYSLKLQLTRAIAAAQQAAASSPNPSDYRSALQELQVARSTIQQASTTTQIWYNKISLIPISSVFPTSERETVKNDIATEQAIIQTSIKTLDTEIRSLQDNSAGYDTQIATEESTLTTSQGTRDKAKADIANFESSIGITQAQLDLKRAGTRPSDIEASKARVRQAQADLYRAQAEYSDTLLRAPIDGTITKVSVKTGEYTPSGAAVTMLGQSPYRIEVYVPEIDIPKVTLTQSGSIELEAFPEVNYALVVSEIDPAATDREGVSKYRVVLDFVYPHDEFKIGMTGDSEIITDSRTNVVYVPGRAIVENDEDEEIIKILQSEDKLVERLVETGMEGEGGNVEIIEGVKEGEEVVVLIKE